MTNYMIDDGLLWAKIDKVYEKVAGVYKVHCLDITPNSGKYVPINRIAGTDEEGVLYIGAASILSYRISNLRRAISSAFEKGYSGADAHQVGAHFKRYSILRKKFDIQRLCVTLYRAEQTEEEPLSYFTAENNHLAEYAERFGELPPLNIRPGGRSFP